MLAYSIEINSSVQLSDNSQFALARKPPAQPFRRTVSIGTFYEKNEVTRVIQILLRSLASQATQRLLRGLSCIA